MREFKYGKRNLYFIEKSDVSKLLSENKGDRLVIPDEIDGMSVGGVHERSFDKIVGIKEIVFPSRLIYVAFMAIADCDVERIVLGKDLEFIDVDGLRTNKKLKHIEVEEASQYYKSIQGNLYIANGNILKYGCNETIAEGTLQIGNQAFINSKVKTIVIPESVKEIGSNAFINCKNLKSVQFRGQNLTTIGDRAFEDCRNLEIINIPGSVLRIGTQAFKSTGLEELIFEDGGEQNRKLMIESRAFMCTDINIVDFSNVNHVVVNAEAFRAAGVVKLTLNRMINLQARAFKLCKIEEITLKSINFSSIEGFDTLGTYTDELKKIMETYNNLDTEVTYFLHKNAWIEERFW